MSVSIYRPERQFVIRRHIADFCCFSARLVVEVDADQLGSAEAIASGALRPTSIEAQGFRVRRSSNLDVARSVDPVLDTIAATAAAEHILNG
jgi:very-short-patch-repair endonuclease